MENTTDFFKTRGERIKQQCKKAANTKVKERVLSLTKDKVQVAKYQNEKTPNKPSHAVKDFKKLLTSFPPTLQIIIKKSQKFNGQPEQNTGLVVPLQVSY